MATNGRNSQDRLLATPIAVTSPFAALSGLSDPFGSPLCPAPIKHARMPLRQQVDKTISGTTPLTRSQGP